MSRPCSVIHIDHILEVNCAADVNLVAVCTAFQMYIIVNSYSLQLFAQITGLYHMCKDPIHAYDVLYCSLVWYVFKTRGSLLVLWSYRHHSVSLQRAQRSIFVTPCVLIYS